MSGRVGDEITTIPLRKATRDRLKGMGGKGETYDAILNRLLDSQAPSPPRRPAGREAPALVDFEPLED